MRATTTVRPRCWPPSWTVTELVDHPQLGIQVTLQHLEVIRACKKRIHLCRISAIADGRITIETSPSSINIPEGPPCSACSSPPSQSLPIPLYLLHKLRKLNGFHQNTVDFDHLMLRGVSEEKRLVFLVIMKDLHIQGSSEQRKSSRSLSPGDHRIS
jgi:hypothetical protein